MVDHSFEIILMNIYFKLRSRTKSPILDLSNPSGRNIPVVKLELPIRVAFSVDVSSECGADVYEPINTPALIVLLL